jgi:uncharacterized protein involved in outer membrane biogenesis
MGALRWLTLLAAALGLAVLAGAWLVPPALDWDRYRGEIAVLASDALGQNVRIDGMVALRLLPQPVLTAERVSVVEGTRGITVTAQELRLRVALAPLLTGRIDARELVVHGLDARLPWPLGEAALALRAPEWLSALSARVDGGSLRIGETVFTDLQATLATRDDTGSWAASGTARQGPRPLHFTARLSRPGADGSAGVDLTLDVQGPGTGTGVALSGQIAADGTVSGRASGRGTDLSDFLPAPPVPFRAEGRFVMGGGLAFVDELAGEIGGSPVRGAVSLRFQPQPRLDVALAASRLDLDAWLPPLLRGGGLSAKLPIGVDISAEAAQLAGGTIRALRVGMAFADGAIRVHAAEAILPGEAALLLDGQVLPANGSGRSAVFDGAVRLSAPVLRTTLAWADAARIGNIAALPPLVLRQAELRAHVVAGAEQLAVDGIQGSLDGARLSGALTLRPGARPQLRGWLGTDRLDLDAWWPSAGAEGPAALAARLGGIEGDLRVEAALAVLRGAALSGFVLDAALEPARVSVRTLTFDMGGVAVQASGTLAEGGRIGDGRLEVRAGDGGLLAGLLPEWPAFVALRGSGLWKGPAAISVMAAGAVEALAVRASADLGDLHAEGQPVLDLPGEKLAGSFLLRHPGAPRLLEALGLPAAAAWMGDGSLSLVAKLNASRQGIGADGFDLSAGGLHATGALAWSGGEEKLLAGRVTADVLPWPDSAWRGAEPILVSGLSGWRAQIRLDIGQVLGATGVLMDHARSTVSLAAGVLRFDDIGGGIVGGQLAGSLRLATTGGIPDVTANISLSDATPSGPVFGLPIDLVGGRISVQAALTAHGFAPATLLASLSGGADIRAERGTLAGLDLGRAGSELAEADLRRALAGGAMGFDRLAATTQIRDGVVRLQQVDIAAPSGAIGAEGSIDLPRRSIDIRLSLHPAVADPPLLGLRLAGPLDAPVRTPELAGLIPWRAARGL